MPKKLRNIEVNSEEELKAFFDDAANQINNADDFIENDYLIKLTDAEKLILHVSLQQLHTIMGNPIAIEEVMVKCLEMIKIETKH